MNKWCLHKYCIGSVYKKYCIFLGCCKCYSSPWWEESPTSPTDRPGVNTTGHHFPFLGRTCPVVVPSNSYKRTVKMMYKLLFLLISSSRFFIST